MSVVDRAARGVVNGAAYRATLEGKWIADVVGAVDPNVAEAFAEVIERFRRMPASKVARARR